MDTVAYVTAITLCMTLNTIASNEPLQLNLSGNGNLRTTTQTYPSAKIYLSGNGVIDASNATINGLAQVNFSGNGRVILNHKNPLHIMLSGNGNVYNLKQSSDLKTTISGNGSVYENTWYPLWYLRNPWIGYIVVPILAAFLAFQGYNSHSVHWILNLIF
jgi:hypothetical protein